MIRIKRWKHSAAGVAAILIVACTGTDDPLATMCQAVAKQLTSNGVAEWGAIDQSDNDRIRTVNVAYTSVTNQPGSISCIYNKDQSGTVETAPTRVSLNGAKVEQKVLLTAGVAASKELLAGTAKNTAAKTTELAKDASKKASELAGQAGDVVQEVGQSLQQLQQNSQ
ncbi:MAG: hypothetical protein KTR35_05255 [Gammaproteobacteria bacterium]|nr:hypothetical protein [Gammaproteobacteria bacterium]